MDIIDLKSREVFGNEGRGIAGIVEEPHLTIRQLGLEPGKSVPVHTTDAPLTIQVIRGEGVFIEDGESVRIGPGKLLRIPKGVSMGIANDSDEPLVVLAIRTPIVEEAPRDKTLEGKPGSFVNLVDFAPVKPGRRSRSWIGSTVRARCSRGIVGSSRGRSSHQSKGAAVTRRSSNTNRRRPSWTCT